MNQDFLNIIEYLLLENIIFLVTSSLFLIIVGWAWRELKPYSLPEVLPSWFKIWFGSVQLLGGILPLITLIVWGFFEYHSSVITAISPIIVMLILQILAEIITLKKIKTVVWVMVPYLYLPYRLWQIYTGLQIVETELIFVRYVLIINLLVWTVNYLLDLAQLPRLFRWQGTENIVNHELQENVDLTLK